MPWNKRLLQMSSLTKLDALAVRILAVEAITISKIAEATVVQAVAPISILVAVYFTGRYISF